MWSAQDALVLKWVALRVAHYLPAHDLCHHLKGRGCHHSLSLVTAALYKGQYQFVYRSDIRGYYQNIRKETLAGLIPQWVPDPVLCNLMTQFIYYSVEQGGVFHTPTHGISRGCALSPLLGGSLLHHVDAWFASRKNVFYVRYMDDFLLLTESRWALRHAIRQLHQFMQPEGFAMHPDKTQIGRLANGFDWVGMWISPSEQSIAPRALENHQKHRLRLYEQARRRGLSESAANDRVQVYVIRWEKWAANLLRITYQEQNNVS
ncbi:reverse transcriptase domain-containing protein [Acinetobacter vivianii]|uniref:Reverse transcriptase domain-containing protein n=1 Tax=Acinetobacter vivianii TaxID=1776742 RepID=A0AAJ6P5V4_9GAMM|nr:reverse transcriptase domain-containing protein [Acinetobacter vivianii]WDZ51801.1 reverse transcriptase domain-containing protein [Acinetobacter vivianii]